MSSHNSAITHIKRARGAAERTDTTVNKTFAPQLRSSHSIFSNFQYSISIQGNGTSDQFRSRALNFFMAKGHTSYCGLVRGPYVDNNRNWCT
jgi:hypothetical protein